MSGPAQPEPELHVALINATWQPSRSRPLNPLAFVITEYRLQTASIQGQLILMMYSSLVVAPGQYRETYLSGFSLFVRLLVIDKGDS